MTRLRPYGLFLALAMGLLVLVAPSSGAATGKGAVAVSRLSTRSPDGKRVAEVRERVAGGEGLFVDGRCVWPPASGGTPARRPTITGRLSWARAGHAVALLAREAGGGTTLVVALVDGAAAGQALEWTVPSAALPARAIMWLSASKVAIGPREMEPKLIASWSPPR